MAEELDKIIEEPSDSQKRITQLSGKVETTAKERDTEKHLREEADGKVAEMQRERDFYAGFADVVSTNPQAKDHKDDILAKVKSGYTVEDATYAVLGKAGKLGQSKVVDTTQITGGSASTSLPSGGATKSVGEMTQSERRAKLIEAQEHGDLAVS